MDADPAAVASLLRIRDGGYADDLVLAAVVRLDLMTVLAEEPASLEELCSRHGIAPRAADVLCTLLRSMGLLEPGPMLRPTPLAHACLVRGAPLDLRPYLAAGAARPECLAQVEVLRTGEPAARGGARAAAPSIRGRLLAPVLAEVLDDLREPGDLHVLCDTLHRWREPRVRQAIAQCFDALDPGGWLVAVDPFLDAGKTGPLPVARYAALVLATTEGRCWSVAEMADLLAGAGFVDVDERPTVLDRTILLGRKPPA